MFSATNLERCLTSLRRALRRKNARILGSNSPATEWIFPTFARCACRRTEINPDSFGVTYDTVMLGTPHAMLRMISHCWRLREHFILQRNEAIAMSRFESARMAFLFYDSTETNRNYLHKYIVERKKVGQRLSFVAPTNLHAEQIVHTNFEFKLTMNESSFGKCINNQGRDQPSRCL